MIACVGKITLPSELYKPESHLARNGRRKLSSKICSIDPTMTMFVTKMCKTGLLHAERTRNHEIENDLDYDERSSLFPDYLILTK